MHVPLDPWGDRGLGVQHIHSDLLESTRKTCPLLYDVQCVCFNPLGSACSNLVLTHPAAEDVTIRTAS